MKFLSTILTSLAVYLSVSCASHETISYRFADDVSDAQREAIIAGANEWAPYTTDDIHVVYDPKGDWLVELPETIKLPPAIIPNEQFDGYECTSVGPDCEKEKWIRIRRGATLERMKVIATHEFGHALHMGHLKDDQVGVMQYMGNSSTLTVLDIEDCQHAGSCEPIQVIPPK